VRLIKIPMAFAITTACALAAFTAPALANYRINKGGAEGKCTNCKFFLSRSKEIPRVECAETIFKTKVENVQVKELQFRWEFKECKAQFKIGGTEVRVKAEIKQKEWQTGLKRGVANGANRWKEIPVRIRKGKLEIRVEVAGLKCQIFIKELNRSGKENQQFKKVDWQNLKEEWQSEAIATVQGIRFTSEGAGCASAEVPKEGQEGRFKGTIKIRGAKHT